MKNIVRKTYNSLPEKIKVILKAQWKKSGLEKKIKKKQAKQRLKKKKDAIAKYGLFTATELTETLKRVGIKEGDILFVQTSFNDLYTLDSSPIELISSIKNLLGNSGTLLMPTYTIPRSDPNWVYNPIKEPTYTGVINEVFRRSQGVIRSLHPRHSICGIGPLAKEILADHEMCTYADGVDSPFDKMRQYPNAKILTLGLPLGYTSFLHWIEDYDPEKLPFRVHEQKPSKIRMKNNSSGFFIDHRIKSSVASKLCLTTISRNISDESYISKTYKGINMNLYFIPKLAEELVKLRNNGIIHYS